MILLVDGKPIPVQNDVCVIYGDPEGDENPTTELHAKLTHEGLILDIIEQHSNAEGVARTACYLIEDLAEMAH